ncbi:MAG: UDP-4-amino-4,6-dideoxy-N-acetyl-beta-L-altrosamine N-acetyltransferase [Gammaproteobacteria bacterium]|nr:UDP-4-amino-4,6-dideoxy-N-acetyl-beta-L-altrosamine N-acetyltransferase [Gammaproteobacteria bacterium]
MGHGCPVTAPLTAMLRLPQPAEREMIRQWRNHPQVRRTMFNDHLISQEEHLNWLQRMASDPTRQLLLFIYQGQAVGVSNFYQIDTVAQSCYWGFYLNPEAGSNSRERLQMWLTIQSESLAYAFTDLACHTLFDETFAFNRQVLEIHRKFGFSEKGRFFRDKNGQPEEVVLMAVTAASFTPLQSNDTPPAVTPPGKQTPTTIALFASSNLELLREDLLAQAKTVPGVSLAITLPPFGQYPLLLRDANSSFAHCDLFIFCERLQDLDKGNDNSALQTYFDTIRLAHEQITARGHGAIYVTDFYFHPDGQAPLSTPLAQQLAPLFAANAALQALCDELASCHLIAISGIALELGYAACDPGKYWQLGRIPYASPFSIAIANALLATLLERAGQAARVIVLDLDNTLWGGVIGDDGMEGIALGERGSGADFQSMQHFLKARQEEGFLLTLCSKNSEEIALACFNHHPGMVLQAEDIVAKRINWQEKSDNLLALAAELGISLQHFCFIDDNPFEREAVRRQLPMVAVPELPAAVAQWPAWLRHYPPLWRYALTTSDRARHQLYQAKQTLQQQASRYASREDFLHSLAISVTFTPLKSDNRQRILQLIHKTNQFNMTSRRYQASELQEITQHGEIWGVSVKDRLSSSDLVGVVILRHLTPESSAIDNLILSCRVLGRGIESAILHWCCQHLQQQGRLKVEAAFIPSARNQPAATLYSDHGFRRQENHFCYDLTQPLPAAPAWITFT